MGEALLKDEEESIGNEGSEGKEHHDVLAQHHPG